MNKLLTGAIGFVLLTFSMAGNAVIINLSGGPAVDDVDKFAGTSQFINAAQFGTIQDVNATVTIAAGSIQWGDIDIELIHGGMSVFLVSETVSQNCCTADEPFNAVFDDAAIATVGSVGFGALVGTFKPEVGSLSVFDGLDINGLWELKITEIFCCEDESDSMTWSLSVQVPEPATLSLMSLGLLGVGYRRRSQS